MRPPAAQDFRPSEGNERTQGAINLWHDLYGGVLFVTIGKRRAARHQWIGDGVALRFDEDTGQCVGFVVLTGMVHADTILPLWAMLMIMNDAIAVNAKID